MSRCLGNLSKMLSLNEWWDRRYLWTIDVSEKIKKFAWSVTASDMNTMGLRTLAELRVSKIGHGLPSS